MSAARHIALGFAVALCIASTSVHYINEVWLTDTVYDDMLIPLSSASRLGTTDPDWKQFKNGVYQYAFDGGGTRDEELMGDIQLTHRWKEGTTIHCHIHHSPETNASGDVRWCSEFTFASINGTFPASSTLCANCTVGGTAYKHYLCDMGDITMTGHTISVIGAGRVYRHATNAADTLDGVDVFGLYVDCHIEIDTMGSRAELVK